MSKGNINEHGLTVAQEKFVQLLIEGKTQAEAYRTVYPRSKAWKRDAVYSKSSQLASSAKVKQRLMQLGERLEETFTLNVADLLREAARLAFLDPAKLIDKENAKVLLPHELDADTRAAVASFEIDEYGRIKYKFWDKNSALERLFKHKGLFEKDNEQKNPIGDLLARLGGRVVGVTAQGDEDDD